MRSTNPKPSLEEKIRARAHEIWLREGRPEGQALTHWQRAEAEIAVADRPKASSRRAAAAAKRDAAPTAAKPRRAPAKAAVAKPGVASPRDATKSAKPKSRAAARSRRKDAAE